MDYFSPLNNRSDTLTNTRYQPFLPHATLFILVTALAAGTIAAEYILNASDEDDDGLGPPVIYEELRNALPEPAGRIRNARFRVDRFNFELDDGELYIVSPPQFHALIVIYLGHGTVRAFPPDGVELQQLRKLTDEDSLHEKFDRFVFWLSGDLGERLRTMADGNLGQESKKAAKLLNERRTRLLEDQLANPDSRVLADLWRTAIEPPLQIPTRSYFYADIDSRDRSWFSIEVDPRDREEIRVASFDRRRKLSNVWMSFHSLDNFESTTPIDGFPRDPEVNGRVAQLDGAAIDHGNDKQWNANDYGLTPRLTVPDNERWTPRISVSRTDVDIAIKGNGDAVASTALVVEALKPVASVRLRVSPFANITDVRWISDLPVNVDNVNQVELLSPYKEDENATPDEPLSINGESLYYIQDTHERRMEDDLHEPWVTAFLPRPMARGDRFIITIAYRGKLIERQRGNRGYLLKDSIYWIPRHIDNRKRRLRLTFRVPESLRIASGGTLASEIVDDGTRIMRWISPTPIRGTMAFQLGRFEIDEIAPDGLPPIAIYADRNHLGFAPGARDRTIKDLIGSMRTYVDYFGPYPFKSLLVTETQEFGGRAFPGLVLLTFQAFGELHTGEAQLFRSHEVAHQWWGASVDWEGYRDQWISEGFAQYAAALYALVGLENEEQFLQMLNAWRYDVLGEVSVGQGLGLQHYGARPAVIRKSDGNESGPVVIGRRLTTTDTPFDYRLIVYEKGAFILHMLRMLLLDLETGSDERFRELMRNFARDYRGDVVNTQSFENAVSAAFGEPMDWFFNQWVYGVDVPTYRSNLDVSALRDSDDPFILYGTIKQENIPNGFKMAVPIQLEFQDRDPMLIRIWVDQPEVSVEIPLPAVPTKVEFNYHHGVLAHVR